MVLRFLDAEYPLRLEAEERARILSRKGEIYLQIFQRPQEAMSCFKGALNALSDELTALRGLSQSAALLGDWRGFAEAAIRAAEAYTDSGISEALRLDAAYALLVDGAPQETLKLLEGEESPEAKELRESAQGAHQMKPLLAFSTPRNRGRLALGPTPVEEQAYKALEEVLSLYPDDPGALLGLERRYLVQGDLKELSEIYAALAQNTLSQGAQLGFMLQRARLLCQDQQQAWWAYRAILLLEPQEREALEAMEKIAHQLRDPDRLAEILPARLSRAQNLERESILLGMGALFSRLNREEEACDSYEAVLEQQPSSYSALSMLHRLYRARGLNEQALLSAEEEGRAALDPQNATQHLLEAGGLREQTQKGEEAALANYLLALRRSPRNPRAFSAIRRLSRNRLNWAGLVEALQIRAQACPEERQEALLEVVELQAQRMGAPEEAALTLERMLQDEAREEPRLLQHLADLYTELERWEAAASAYDRLRFLSSDRELQRALCFRLIAIYKKLDDPERAQLLLEEVLREYSDDQEILKKQLQLAREAGAAREALKILRRLLLNAEPKQRDDYRIQMAEIELEAGRLEEALNLLSFIWQRGNRTRQLLERLLVLLVRLRRPEALRRLFEELGEESEELRSLRLESLLAAEAPPQPLLRELEEALMEQPEDLSLRKLQARALSKTPALKEACAAQLWLARHQPFELEPLRVMCRLRERMGDRDRSYEISRLLLALGDRKETALLREWKLRLNSWPQRSLKVLDWEQLWRGLKTAPLQLLAALEKRLPQIFRPEQLSLSPVPSELQVLGRKIQACFGLTGELFLDKRPLDLSLPSGDAWSISWKILEEGELKQRFFLAGGMALGHAQLSALSRWSSSLLRRRLEALLLIFGFPLEQPLSPPHALEEQAAHFRPLLKREQRLKPLLRDLAKQLPSMDLQDLRRRCESFGHRSGILLSEGIYSGLVSLTQPQAREELLRWSLGEEYFGLRVALEICPES